MEKFVCFVFELWGGGFPLFMDKEMLFYAEEL